VTLAGSAQEREALYDELVREAASPAPRSRLLRTREVAVLFQVSERAVTDWAARGLIPSLRTPGGHRRYPAAEVLELVEQQRESRR
jgi:excisionase family DNA binding protein